MKPVSPVFPELEEHEFVLAEDQPQYQPLPVVALKGEERRMVSRWLFTDEERELIACGGTLLVEQLTFGNPFHPLALSVWYEQSS